MAAIEWVLCDLGKTLIDFDHDAVGRRLIDLLKSDPSRTPSGRTPDLAALYEFMFDAPDGGASRNIRIDRGETDLADLARDLRSAFDIHVTAAELKPIWSEIFTTVHDDVIAAMKRARDRGYRVAICSSTNAPHWEYVVANYPRIFGFWDDCFLSYRMGYAKTDPEFFPLIAKTTGCAPEAHLFLDDVQDNIDSARAAGMQAILFEGTLPNHEAWSG